MSDSCHVIRVESPIGRIEIVSDGDAVTRLSIAHDGRLPNDTVPELSDSVLDTAAEQLGEYFAGLRRTFTIPVHLTGTPFQRAVWEQLAQVEFGTLTSYGTLGESLGYTGYGRAVGGAVGANPVPIIIGCHRVLSASGAVTGYSGGDGIPTKMWLLRHEGVTLAE